jgi:hypothetical protein
MVTCGLVTVQAADTTLTLACQGTTTNLTHTDAKPEPISMGIIVNFTARTVTGFDDNSPVTITRFDDLHISFSGSRGNYWTIEGSMDRVTGDMEALSTVWELTRDLKSKVALSQALALKCKPTQRMF